ncbi:enoyl-CoA hydratase-related protein [Amycolatopsis sp. WGS_07]
MDPAEPARGAQRAQRRTRRRIRRRAHPVRERPRGASARDHRDGPGVLRRRRSELVRPGTPGHRARIPPPGREDAGTPPADRETGDRRAQRSHRGGRAGNRDGLRPGGGGAQRPHRRRAREFRTAARRGGAVRLARAVGPARAKYLAFTGQLFPAEYFLPWGLVNEVVDDDALGKRVQELAELVAEKSPLVLAGAKHLIDEAADQSLEAGLRAERVAMYAHMHTADMQEGLAAFAEKRTPRYTGR